MIIGKTRTNQPVEGDVEGLSELFETGEVENAKPIYCHPITMYLNSENAKYLVSCMILSPKSTAYTKDELKDLVRNFTGRLLCTGSYQNSTVGYVAVTCVNSREDGLWLIGWNTSGTYIGEGNINFAHVIDYSTSFTDDINKIN